uniref:Transmembrane domain-containing protein n=1 Tax=Spironucleus salmonicida TaxID=348837 RepID=V6LV74_9EUKA|eukprot:EST44679.1 Transmembrane domain-containing protein [Spironucleus salmonicida]
MNIQQCLVCRPGLGHIKGNCGTATAPENDQLRGTCIATANQLFCGECQEGWGGAVCSECTQGYISCDCHTEAFSRCCCPLLQSPTGVCFRNQMGVAECDYCGPRFILVVDQCVVERISPGYMTFVIAVPVLSFLLLLVLLIVILRLSKAGKRKIVVYAKRQIKRIGPHLIFVMLSQALAIIIAIQDVYINDFFMQIAVNIFSMVPFVLVLFLLAVPTYTQFFYNLPSHFFLFILAALLELSFHFVQYQVVSDVVHDFGEQIYKLAWSARDALHVCISGWLPLQILAEAGGVHRNHVTDIRIDPICDLRYRAVRVFLGILQLEYHIRADHGQHCNTAKWCPVLSVRPDTREIRRGRCHRETFPGILYGKQHGRSNIPKRDNKIDSRI